MPIVVKLSHAFYDRFGDALVDELIGVLNQVDAASQQSLRDLNEANWGRFEDRLNRGLAEVRGEIVGLDGRLTGILHTEIARLDAKLSAQFVSHLRWTIGMWGAVMLAVLGLWFKR